MPVRKPDNLVKKSKPTTLELVAEYQSLHSKVKTLSTRLEEVKQKLKSVVDTKGYTTPDGSRRYELNESTELIQTLRSSVSLVPEAVQLVEKNLPDLRLIETIKVIREDKLQTMVENGKVTARMAKRLYSISESFAFSIKEIKHEKEKNKRKNN